MFHVLGVRQRCKQIIVKIAPHIIIIKFIIISPGIYHILIFFVGISSVQVAV